MHANGYQALIRTIQFNVFIMIISCLCKHSYLSVRRKFLKVCQCPNVYPADKKGRKLCLQSTKKDKSYVPSRQKNTKVSSKYICSYQT